MNDAYLENEISVKYTTGILYDQKKGNAMPKNKLKELNASCKENNGGICIVCYSSFEDVNTDPSCEMMELKCRHQFCRGCWTDYLTEQLEKRY